MLRAVLKFLHLKLWKHPKDSHGVTWTLLFWLHVLLGLFLSSIVCKQPGGFWLLLSYMFVTMALNRLKWDRRDARSLSRRRA